MLPVNVPDCPALTLRSPPVPPVVRLPFHVNPVVSSTNPAVLPPPVCEPPIVRVSPLPEPPRFAALLTSTVPASIVVLVWELVPPSVRVPLFGLVVLMMRFVSVIAVLYVKLPVGTSQSVVPRPFEVQLWAAAGTGIAAELARAPRSAKMTTEDQPGLHARVSARRASRHISTQLATRPREESSRDAPRCVAELTGLGPAVRARSSRSAGRLKIVPRLRVDRSRAWSIDPDAQSASG